MSVKFGSVNNIKMVIPMQFVLSLLLKSTGQRKDALSKWEMCHKVVKLLCTGCQ